MALGEIEKLNNKVVIKDMLDSKTTTTNKQKLGPICFICKTH